MKPLLKSVITEPTSLYGRNKPGGILDKLTGHLNRFNNIQIVGERRFGKTSVLRCLQTKLKSDEKFILIFIDLKEYSFIKGNANVYRFILARVVEEMSKSGLLNDGIVLKGINFYKCVNWEDFYESLISVADYRMNDVLKEFFNFFSEYYQKTFILLIDEYEHLFLYSFDDPKGFFLFRNIGQQNINDKLVPLCFVIAGTMTWDKICTLTGSAELNTLSSEMIYVDPLKIDHFNDWFQNRLKLEADKHNIKNDVLYNLAGGVPFYAMIIIESLEAKTPITFKTLYPHFEEIYKNLDERESSILTKIVKKEPIDVKNIVFQMLLNKGILSIEKSKVFIKSDLFKDYLLSKTDLNISSIEAEQSELYQIVSTIFKNMAGINETCENKAKALIFKPVNQDPFLQSDMQLKCVDSDDIKRFSGAVYMTIFEKTKLNNKSLGLLPTQFQLQNQFVKTVDSLRHFFGGHLKDTFTVRAGQLSKSDLLIRILNSPNNPIDSDYIKIQKYVLKNFIDYLKDIEAFVKDKKNDHKW